MAKNIDENAIQAVITKDERRFTGWVSGVVTDGATFCAKVFDNGSVFGIDDGRVSKLDIRKAGEILANYDRGWDIEPQKPEDKAVYKRVMAALNALGKVSEMDKPKGLLAKIEDNKHKINHDRTFSVAITETLKTTVEIEAASREEAEQIASDNWRNSEYILDADNFAGVEFEAALAKREKAKGEELC
jgi:hypothetical protein